MPGIVGIYGPQPQAPDRLRRMVATLCREGSVTRGVSHDAMQGLHLGWAVRKDAPCDSIVGEDQARGITIVLSGEVLDIDHCRVGATDVQALADLYDSHGDGFVDRLNGTFCGVLVDRRRGRALVFNDRYGAQRLYVHEDGDTSYFATEAKALLEVLPATRRMSAAAVADVFATGCVMGDRSLFEGIRLLPPGSCRVLEHGRIDARLYFEPGAWERSPPLDAASFSSALYETFAALLPSYLRGPSRIGMSLTGGLDGRMIMACARPSEGSLPCYSFGGTFRDCHDVILARRIATLCGQAHHTLTVGPAMLREFDSLAERCVEVSDGTMDVSGAVELYVNRLAHDIAPVRLTGNYGSEILRRHVAFRPRGPSPNLEPQMQTRVRDAARAYDAERQGRSDLAFVACRQVPWHHHARRSVEQSVLATRSPFLDNRLVALMFRAPPELRGSPAPTMHCIAQGHAGLADVPTDRGLVAGRTSVFSRLRHVIREFGVRAEYAYDYGMPGPLVTIDRLLSPLRPERLFLGRHKFYHFRLWYRRELASYLRDMLLGPNAAARVWYRPGALHRMVDEHTQGRANHTLDLHRALTLELTQRVLLDRIGGSS